MKKFLLALVVSLCSVAHAEYTPENKIIKVVIPQPPASGLGYIYNHIEAYARKQNINMIPVYKPGANGKIGISYAGEQKNDGNTLLFTTLSDMVESAADANFDKVAPVTKIALVLVASSKSKIKDVNDIITRERTSPGRLTWSYSSSAQLPLIKSFIQANGLDSDKVYVVPFSQGPGYQTGIANGDVDLGFMIPSVAGALASKGYVSIIDISDKTNQILNKKENGTALFLPKNNAGEAKMFWNNFVKELYNDAEFKKVLKDQHIDHYKSIESADLEKIIAGWKI
jgi:tripartite-type tricarboxylate transporter receptor subunit TctC